MTKEDYKKARKIARQMVANADDLATVKALKAQLQPYRDGMGADEDIKNIQEMICLDYYYLRGLSHEEIRLHVYGGGVAKSYVANRIYNVFKRKKEKENKK